jgi:UDP-N-acetylmuramate-alanine ligase
VCEGIKDGQRLLVVYHPATYTQRMGKMDQEVVDALAMADQVIVLLPPKHQMDWSLYEQSLMLGCDTEQALADCVQSIIQPQDVIIVMSANYLEAFWAVLLSHLQLRFGKQDCILQDEALR